MSYQKKIARFNQENKPFAVLDIQTGRFSLELRFTFFFGKYRDFGREVFRQYALECEEAPEEYGSGYDWETIFKKMFEHDVRLQEIEFDSEAGGFYCYSSNLDLLIEFGSRFKRVCENKEQFAALVSTALAEEKQRKQYDYDNRTLRWHLQDCARCSLEIETPECHLFIERGHAKKLLKGIDIEVYDCRTEKYNRMPAKELLNLSIGEREDDWEHYHVRMKTDHHLEVSEGNEDLNSVIQM